MPPKPEIGVLHRQAAARGDVIAMAGGLPARELLPRGALERALREAGTREALQYGWPEGADRLRAWVAERLRARGFAIEPDAVIVTAGAQQALSLAAAHLRPGARIAVGAETYPAALSAFEAAGVRAVACAPRVDAHYLIVGASNPHGVDRVSARRAELLGGGSVLLADEAYAELRFDGATPPPLAAAAPDRVWHVGTVSKVLAPGLRVGWLVPPRQARKSVLASKEAADLQTGSLAQAVLLRLLGELDYDALVARARRFYAARAEVLAHELRARLPELSFVEPEGGFSLWVESDEPGDDVELLEAAVAGGVSFDPGSMFRPDRKASPIAFRLSFSACDPAALAAGTRRLARVLARWRRRAKGD